MDPSLITGTPTTIPDIPFGAISAEFVLFIVALIVIGIEAAGKDRKGAGFFFAGLTTAGAGAGLYFGAHLAGIVVITSALLVLGLSQFIIVMLAKEKTRLLSAAISWVGLAITLGVAVAQWLYMQPTLQVKDPITGMDYPILGAQSFLNGFVLLDGMGLFVRISLIIFGLLVIPMSYAYLEARQIHRVEYYPLIVLTILGMSLMANTNHLLMIFLSLEIFSLALYILTALAKRDEFSQEAAVKYFVMGGGASAVFLYGAAIMYGLSGTMVVSKLAAPIAADPGYKWAVVSALVLMATGLSFKVGIVPFHFWMPDVYQGAPTPVTAFMAAATKAAAFAAFMRIFGFGLGWVQWTWMPMIGWMAGITMLFGAIGALLQKDVKRILGYSAIAHAGYIALALMGTTFSKQGGFEAVSAMVLYLFLYGITVIGTFGVVSYLERRDNKALAISDLAGLAKTNPFVASAFTFFLLGLAGIPTTAGFIGKFAVFRSAFLGGHGFLVAIAVVTSVIAAAFYLKIIGPMWLDKPKTDRLYPVMSLGETFTLGLTAVLTVAFGLLPGLIVALSHSASSMASSL